MTLPLYPIWLVDLVGSLATIVFAFLSLRLARRLRDQDVDNVVWTYLFWLCVALVVFALSRSVGHFGKRLLILSGRSDIWEEIQPYSGSFNTIAFILVASITLFFERSWNIYQKILSDRQVIHEAHERLVFMNRNLEDLVTKRTEERGLSERKFRRIFELSPDMILLTTAEGRIIDMNPAGHLMLGYADQREWPKPLKLGDLFNRPRDWETVRLGLDRDGSLTGSEIDLRRADGRLFSSLLSAAVDRDAKGAIDAIHFLVKDISQRKSMERQLLQADKLASIGQLASGIAHEINNPLSMILGYTQLLLRAEEPDTQRCADLRIIEKHARNCKTIVGDLLSFARSSHTNKEAARLHDVLEEVFSVVRNHFESDGVVIESSFDTGMPPLTLDVGKMKQVFMNLLMNAKQAIDKKGVIQVDTVYDKDIRLAAIHVTDNGCGVDPEIMSRIFDPFFTTKATGEGTGLGLSVSYGIVKGHGGEILVESEPGIGTTFRVLLPVDTEDSPEP
jgi:two-component system, NtrC family, sensor kinase